MQQASYIESELAILFSTDLSLFHCFNLNFSPLLIYIEQIFQQRREERMAKEKKVEFTAEGG